MSIQPILQALDQLEKMHQSLLSIANEKTTLIKKGNMAALDDLLKGEQAHLAAIHQIENERQRLVIDFFTRRSKAVQQDDLPTISDMIDIVEREEEKQLLTAAKDRLLHVIGELKWQNDLNQRLTFQSLQFVNLSLDMIRPQQEAMNYSKNEIEGANELKQSSSFDSQA